MSSTDSKEAKITPERAGAINDTPPAVSHETKTPKPESKKSSNIILKKVSYLNLSCLSEIMINRVKQVQSFVEQRPMCCILFPSDLDIINFKNCIIGYNNYKPGNILGEHAECNAIRKFTKKYGREAYNVKLTMIVVRVMPGYDGTISFNDALRLAKPCCDCSQYIKTCGLKIKKIIYSIDRGFKHEKASQFPEGTVTISQRVRLLRHNTWKNPNKKS